MYDRSIPLSPNAGPPLALLLTRTLTRTESDSERVTAESRVPGLLEALLWIPRISDCSLPDPQCLQVLLPMEATYSSLRLWSPAADSATAGGRFNSSTMVPVQVVLWLALTGTASCTISGKLSLVIGMKHRALLMSHRPEPAFISLNRLSKSIDRLVEIQGDYERNFNTLTESFSTFTAFFSALTAIIIPYTIIQAGHSFGPYWAAAGTCMGIAIVTSPVWTKPFRKTHESYGPAQQIKRRRSSQAAGYAIGC